jgi:DNA polymerase (family 10)
MAEACIRLGYSYLCITDHSQSAAYAGGLKPDKVRQQHAEIDQLNHELAPFRIFKGIESDILRDGSLDYSPDVLASFDFVIGSIHQHFQMSEAEATERLIRAIQNPYLTILGHPTGRLLLNRAGYPINHRRVIEAAAEYGASIELNCNPWRLDLDWSWLREATALGVPIAISPDAHSIPDLAYVDYGVRVGRKGWLTPSQTLNSRTANELESYFNASRSRA